MGAGLHEETRQAKPGWSAAVRVLCH